MFCQDPASILNGQAAGGVKLRPAMSHIPAPTSHTPLPSTASQLHLPAVDGSPQIDTSQVTPLLLPSPCPTSTPVAQRGVRFGFLKSFANAVGKGGGGWVGQWCVSVPGGGGGGTGFIGGRGAERHCQLTQGSCAAASVAPASAALRAWLP
jgi:hypothetical protein